MKTSQPSAAALEEVRLRERRRARARFRTVLLLLAPALLFLFGVYIVPLGQILYLSFQNPPWSITHYLQIFYDPVYLIVLWRTVRLALEVMALCLFIGYPIAYLMLISSRRMRRVITLLVVATLWTSILVRSYAWMAILGRQGLVNEALQTIGFTDAPMPLLYNRFSVYVGMVHVMLPFMILPLFSVMQRIDLRLVSAARSLGAGPTAAFVLVFLPLSLPGVLAGSLLVVILSLGFFVTPALLGGLQDITFVMLIERHVNRLFNWELAAAMSMVLLVVTIALVMLYMRILSTNAPGASRQASVAAPRWLLRFFTTLTASLKRISLRIGKTFVGMPRPDRRQSVPVAAALGWAGVIFLVAPISIIFPLSFSDASFLQFPPPAYSLRWYENYFSRPDWIGPTITSFKVAGITMVLATIIGTLAAIPIARTQFPGKRLLVGFLLSPMIVPVIVLAVAFYFLFARLKLVGTPLGLVLGHLVLALPFVIVVITSALQSTDESLERAAQTLGASPVRAFTRITLPLIRPAILTGGLFAFLASFDELVIALFISGTGSKTLPKRLWDGIREEIDPTTAAVAALLTVFSLVLLLVAEIARNRVRRGRRDEAGFGGLMR